MDLQDSGKLELEGATTSPAHFQRTCQDINLSVDLVVCHDRAAADADAYLKFW